MINRVAVNNVVLAYETHGDPAAPTVIGLQGLAEGRRFWPAHFTHAVIGAGYHLVLVDNRDIGDSSVMNDAGPVDLIRLMSGDRVAVPYTIVDMAADTLTLMDHLTLRSAHVVGYSLGGMIAQWMDIEHPERVASLVPLMTSSGAPDLAPGIQPRSTR